MNQAETSPVTLSESAAKRIAFLRTQENNPGVKLRVSVSGGGCSGFSYGFEFDDQQNDDDTVIERNGVEVLIDEVSMMYLAGSEIDYVEDLMASAFAIKNPNASSSCGCGSSFSI